MCPCVKHGQTQELEKDKPWELTMRRVQSGTSRLDKEAPRGTKSSVFFGEGGPSHAHSTGEFYVLYYVHDILCIYIYIQYIDI